MFIERILSLLRTLLFCFIAQTTQNKTFLAALFPIKSHSLIVGVMDIYVKETQKKPMVSINHRLRAKRDTSSNYLPFTISHNLFEFSGISRISKSTSNNASSNACANNGPT